MNATETPMASVEQSLPRFCLVCSGDPDAVFELRFIGTADVVVHAACLHCPPSSLPIGEAPAYQDRKSTT